MKIALGLDYRLLQMAKQLPEITYIHTPKTRVISLLDTVIIGIEVDLVLF